MGQRIGGVLNITIDGNQYPLRGNWSVTPSSVKREGIAGQDNVHGYTEMPIVPGAKGDFSTIPGLSLTALQNITDSTMQITLANGTTYVLAGAWTNAAFEINTAEGRFAADFGCLTCDET
jgi:hypothetical protein